MENHSPAARVIGGVVLVFMLLLLAGNCHSSSGDASTSDFHSTTNTDGSTVDTTTSFGHTTTCTTAPDGSQSHCETN